MPDITVQDLIRHEATQQGVPPALALAVAEQESGFNPTAVNPKAVGDEHATGTFQLLPSTAKGLGIDATDPAQNITGGVRYLRQLLDQHHGDLSQVLATYGGVKTDTTYVPQVLARVAKFQGSAAPTTPSPKGPTGRASGAGPVGQGGAAGPGPAEADKDSELPDMGAAAKALIAPLDPRTAEGRENLAGMAGSAAVGYATGGLGEAVGILPWIARTLGPIMGAAGGGAAENATEHAIGSGDPNRTPLQAAMTQGLYETAGQMFLWPFRRLAKSFVAPSVSRAADEATAAGIDRARAGSRAATERARLDGRSAVAAVKAATSQATETATQQRIGSDAAATAAAATNKAFATQPYDRLADNPPSTISAIHAVQDVVKGPVKRALDLAGQRVSDAAAQGPPVSMEPIHTALGKMLDAARPAGYGERQAPARGIGFLIASMRPRAIGAAASAGGATEAERTQLAKVVADQLGIAPDHMHPDLPGALGEIANAPSQVSFADAHRWKRILDESVNWDRTAKRHLESITKGLRQTLRGEMAGFAPYDTATAAYQALVPLYRKGVGRQLIRAATDNPDSVMSVLNPKKPAAAQAVQDLLVTQSAAGGDAAAGQTAWDSLRGAFTHRTLIKGGVEGLADRVHAMVTDNPEFARVVFGDRTGQTVLSNLVRIGQAATTAMKEAENRLAATTAAGKATVSTVKATGAAAKTAARDAAADAIRAARTAGTSTVEAARRVRQQFERSTVANPRTVGHEAVDLVHGAVAPHTRWGQMSILRLLSGPKSADLVRWAAYSPALTRQFVKVLTGVVPDAASAAFVRGAISAVNSGDAGEPDESASTPEGSNASPAQ